jgi:hypothetical protein
LRYLRCQVSHPNLVAAVAYPHGRRLSVEEVVQFGIVGRVVYASHVQILSIARHPASLGGYQHGRLQSREQFGGVVPARRVISDRELHDPVRGYRSFERRRAEFVGDLRHGVAKAFQRPADEDRSGRAIGLWSARCTNVESGADYRHARIVEEVLGRLGAEIVRKIPLES